MWSILKNYISQPHHIYIYCMYTICNAELYLTGTSYLHLLHVYYFYCRTIFHRHIIFLSVACILSLLKNYIPQPHHIYIWHMYTIFIAELYLTGTSFLYLFHVCYLYCWTISRRHFIFISAACILSLL